MRIPFIMNHYRYAFTSENTVNSTTYSMEHHHKMGVKKAIDTNSAIFLYIFSPFKVYLLLELNFSPDCRSEEKVSNGPSKYRSSSFLMVAASTFQ